MKDQATADRSRVLYISHRVPWPPDKGDRIRNWNVLKQLTTFARVSLATLDDEVSPQRERGRLTSCAQVAVIPQPRSRRLLGALGFAVARRSLSEGAFYNPKLRDAIEAWHAAAPFDAAVVSASSLVPYLRLTNLKDVPAFIDVVDVDSRKWQDFAGAKGGWKKRLYRFESHRIQILERDLATWANTITLVSDAETKTFNEIAGRECAITATNGVDLEYFQPADAVESEAVAFVGAMDYLPNVDAVAWFARELWPAIRQKKPDAEFRIIGRNPVREVQALATLPGVKVIGGVPDVRPHIAEAAIVVAPMRLGRGLQNKVLEALAMGKAVVASPQALAALGTVPGRDLMQAESPWKWVEYTAELLGNENRRRELGAGGRKYVEEHHDWETCLRPLMDRVRAAVPEECPA